MTRLRNNTHSPYTIVSLNGPVHIDAYGEAEGEFAPKYLALLEAGKAITVLGDEAGNGEDGGAEAAVTLRQEYEALAGKPADKRWKGARLAEEIAALKA